MIKNKKKLQAERTGGLIVGVVKRCQQKSKIDSDLSKREK